MATLFTVAPGNSSNTELQNKKENSPASANKCITSPVHHTGKTACLTKPRLEAPQNFLLKQTNTGTLCH